MAGTVDDAVVIASPNHGTAIGDAVCAAPIPLAGCTEAVRQQTTTSDFIAAVSRGDETPGPVDYTSIHSTIADAIVPNFAEPYTLAVDGAANIVVQGLCPLRVVDHIGAVTDPLVYALVRDALDNDGPALPQRVGDGACTALSPEGFSPVQVVIQETTYLPGRVGGGHDAVRTGTAAVRLRPALMIVRWFQSSRR